jgi:uncharacterized membrane protein YdbT with pleckstrin-like domain
MSPLQPVAVAPSLAKSLRLLHDEHVVLTTRRTSWVATFFKIVTLGLYVPWWRAAWFVVTDQRVIAKEGIFNKTEVALPLHFFQDATVHVSWLGVGCVDISTAGGSEGSLCLEPLKADDARRLADTIGHQAKPSAPGTSSANSHHDAVTSTLERLAALRGSGVLTEEEFAQQKARVLGQETA